jgi:thioredoxin-dependent peroxiredoxin
MIKQGNKAPKFIAHDQHGNEVSNESLIGKKYILFFYGQDDTPTCTKQVCSANDVFTKTLKAGYTTYGVSPDKPAKHLKFISKYDLKINLLSDPSKDMMFAFEAYGPKIFMGKEVIGVYRKAYFIDAAGKIEKIFDDVKAAEQGKLIEENL